MLRNKKTRKSQQKKSANRLFLFSSFLFKEIENITTGTIPFSNVTTPFFGFPGDCNIHEHCGGLDKGNSISFNIY